MDMICECGRIGIYWDNLGDGLNAPSTFCPHCNGRNCRVIQIEEEVEVNVPPPRIKEMKVRIDVDERYYPDEPRKYAVVTFWPEKGNAIAFKFPTQFKNYEGFIEDIKKLADSFQGLKENI